MQTTRTPYSISFMATVLLLLLFACHSTVANAAVALGATRVIYPANQKQVLLPVTNNDPASVGNDSNLLIVFYVQIMPDDFVMQLHRF